MNNSLPKKYNYHPVQPNHQKRGRNLPQRNATQISQPSQIPPVISGSIPNIFSKADDRHLTRSGRLHCQAIERTAIYTDANGNRIVLKENTTTMNTDKDGAVLSFTNNGRRFTKRR